MNYDDLMELLETQAVEYGLNIIELDYEGEISR